MIAVAVVGCLLGGLDAMRVRILARKYRSFSEAAARRERRCRQIDAMDSVSKDCLAKDAYDEEFVFLSDPAENRRAIRYFADLRIRYEYAANHPRDPVPPVPK